MNYVDIAVVRAAASDLRLVEEHGAFMPCQWRPDPRTVPCSRPAEYLVASTTRVAGGGGLVVGPLWICRWHLEQEIDGPAEEQPLSGRVDNPGFPL